jgi:hypothetical protein
MRRALTVIMASCVAFAGCHNTVILSGGGIHPVVIDKEVAPELQCAVIAMQFIHEDQQRIALEACQEIAAEGAKKAQVKP